MHVRDVLAGAIAVHADADAAYSAGPAAAGARLLLVPLTLLP